MHSQVGSCPHCGAPIYTETVWHGITPPPSIYSCSCRLLKQQQPTFFSCNHCHCRVAHSTTAGPAHRVCCKCGDRVVAMGDAFYSHPDTTWLLPTVTSIGSQQIL